jgi:hypothetical protein
LLGRGEAAGVGSFIENPDKMMKKPGISLRDVKRDWCAYVLKKPGISPGGSG